MAREISEKLGERRVTEVKRKMKKLSPVQLRVMLRVETWKDKTSIAANHRGSMMTQWHLSLGVMVSEAARSGWGLGWNWEHQVFGPLFTSLAAKKSQLRRSWSRESFISLCINICKWELSEPVWELKENNHFNTQDDSIHFLRNWREKNKPKFRWRD